MSRETRLFKSEERRSRSEVSQFLHQIADKIGNGQVILRQGQEELTLTIPANLVLEVQVEDEDKRAKGVQHSLEIELKWFDGDDGTSGSLELG
ncbi:MAG: amphi-Trp domain-containing protein [Caldilineaceae bacterium]|nr:amphi-Trp domain-containing protein [Caldilineaceae bacterium]